MIKMYLKIQDIFTRRNEFLPDMSGGQTWHPFTAGMTESMAPIYCKDDRVFKSLVDQIRIHSLDLLGPVVCSKLMMLFVNKMLNFKHKNATIFANKMCGTFAVQIFLKFFSKNTSTIAFVSTVRLKEFSTDNFIKITML